MYNPISPRQIPALCASGAIIEVLVGANDFLLRLHSVDLLDILHPLLHLLHVLVLLVGQLRIDLDCGHGAGLRRGILEWLLRDLYPSSLLESCWSVLESLPSRLEPLLEVAMD